MARQRNEKKNQKAGGGLFTRREIALAPDHGWRATPGYQICVISRGDLRFEFPSGWVTVPGPTSIKLHDRPHPDDDMVLEVSVLRSPPVDWSRLPLSQLLLSGLHHQGHLVRDDQVRNLDLPGLQLAWAEYREIDKAANREAVWRMAHCRPGDGIVLPVSLVGILTFGFWPDVYDRADPVWDHVIRSLVMGEQIADPARGPRYH
jgi:hypothetical protein